jgi:hypothetical protein
MMGMVTARRTFYISRIYRCRKERIMVIIDAYVALTLLVLVLVASVLAVAVLVIALTRLGAEHRRRRLARHGSVPAYDRHLALGH